MINIVNLTPHAVNCDGSVFAPSGRVARVSSAPMTVGRLYEIPVVRCSYGETVDLPNEENETVFIVSTVVRLANPDRLDLVSPTDFVRNEAGQIVGCRAFEVTDHLEIPRWDT